METTINTLEDKLQRCKEIRAKKVSLTRSGISLPLAFTLPQSALHCYIVIVESVETLERLLRIRSQPGDLTASQPIER